jgi:hypothetical protein
MEREPWEDPALEARLRAAMLPPAPELRARVLERCRRAELQAAGRRRAARRWAAALATCVVAQWCVAALLDGQRSMMLRGGASPGPSLVATHGSVRSLPAGSMAFTVGQPDPRLAIE